MKQYSFEAFTTAALVLAFTYRDRRSGVAWLTVLSVLAPPCALPSMFVLGGIVIWLAVEARSSRQYRVLVQVAAASAIGLGISVVYNLLVGSDRHYMVFWWTRAQGFAPFPPTSSADWYWYWDALVKLAYLPRNIGAATPRPLGFAHDVLGQTCGLLFAACALIATWSRRSVAIVSVLTVGITLAVSAAKFYPFSSRLLLFAFPLLAIIIATTIDEVADRISNVAALCLLALLILLLVPSAASYVLNPPNLANVKEAMAIINAEAKAGDALTVAGSVSIPAFYAEYLSPDPPPKMIDVKKLTDAATTASEVAGQSRLWFLSPTEGAKIVTKLEACCKAYPILKRWEDHRTTLLLLDLTTHP
jgi:hypothetical protein